MGDNVDSMSNEAPHVPETHPRAARLPGAVRASGPGYSLGTGEGPARRGIMLGEPTGVANGQVYMAKLAEQAERYEEVSGTASPTLGTHHSAAPPAVWLVFAQMVEYMKLVAKNTSEDLTLEERNLLSVAYKNVVGARRASLRIIGSIHEKEKEKSGSTRVNLVESYKAKVEEELQQICNDILDLLNNDLLPNAGSAAEPSVFYQKMKVRAPPPLATHP